MNTVDMSSYVKKNEDFIKIINESNISILQSNNECFNIFNLTKITNKLYGSIVEVGICGGGSSYIIDKSKNKDKKLYLFDTFIGLQDTNQNDGTLTNGFAKFDNEEFINNLFKNNSSVKVIKEYFPDVILNDIEFNNEKFSLVHLDVDTYQSTLNCLRYFYNKMEKNGIILTHDYNNVSAPGVRMAFDEFFDNKEEHIISLFDSQAMIIKI